jgi:hypothetical protein
MKNIYLLLSVFLFSIANAYGAILANTGVYFGGSNGEYGLSLIQDTQINDYTSFFFNYKNGVFTAESANVDESSDWYLVYPGDNFNATSISEGEFLLLYKTSVARVTKSVSNDFYLGFATTASGPSYSGPNRNIFGWVNLAEVNGELVMKQSAITYDEGGLIVAAPLPSSIVFFSSSILPLVAFLRKNKQRKACS